METSESSRRQLAGLPLIRGNVAGIDLGSERHWVCAPTLDGRGREIADFGATTPELVRMAEWLKARQVESVAMESTGVYWIAPHEVLEGQSFKVLTGGYTPTGAGPGARQEDRPDRLRVDSAAARLRIIARLVSAGGSRVHATDAGAR